MMAPRFVAVLDVGKTNVKLVVHDLDTDRDVFVRTRPNAVLAGPPYPHFDLPGIWAFAQEALKAAAAEHRIDAVTATTHGASIVLLDASGAPLPMLDYEHAGPDERGAAYDAERPAFSESFSPRLPGGLNIGAQLAWIEEAHAALFARAARILTYPQYWTWRLSGVARTEPTSLGAHTDLWAPDDRRWSSLVAARGWDRRMAPLGSAFEVLGPVTADVAAATGLSPDTPVVSGIHDSNASLLPHLLSRTPPFAVISTGTWVIVFAPGASAAGLDPARDGLANVDAFARPVPSARWMGGREFDLLTEGKAEAPRAEDVRRVLADGVMVLPTFAPGCGPFPGARGRWSTDRDALAPGERTAAASLYAALMTAEALTVAGADGPSVVEGPFARNGLFLEAVARLTRRPVLASGNATGTSTGAALLALGRTASIAPPAASPAGTTFDLDGLEDYAAAWRDAAARAGG